MNSACVRIFVLGGLLACFALSAQSPGLSRTEIMDLYVEAKDLFREANELVGTDPETAKDIYRKSILRFERIVREGDIHNGKLYYNIGNAYFRIKDIGRAILYYLRAAQFNPNDPNLIQNLQYARDRCVDRIEERQQTRVLKTLFFWHYDLSSQTRSFLFGLGFVTAWTAAGLLLYFKRPFLRWTLTLSAGLAVIMLVSLLIEHSIRKRKSPGVIVSTEVIARKGDSDTYERSFKDPLHAGTEFQLLQNRGDWYQIELADARSCWIPATSGELVRPKNTE